MTSYILQVALTSVFGVTLASIIFIFKLGTENLSSRGAKLLVAATKISYSVARTNTFIALAIAIATTIRIPQVPPANEQDFTQHLAFLQVQLGWATFVSSKQWDVTKSSSNSFLYYALIVQCLQLSNFLRYLFDSRAKLLGSFNAACVLEQGYPKSFYMAPSEQETHRYSSLGGLMLGLALPILAATVYYFAERILPLVDKSDRIFLTFCSTFRFKPRHSFWVHVLVPCAAALWIMWSSALLGLLGEDRRRLQQASGDLDQDTQWGFGQVTAVLAWAPPLHDIVSETIGSSSLNQTNP